MLHCLSAWVCACRAGLRPQQSKALMGCTTSMNLTSTRYACCCHRVRSAHSALVFLQMRLAIMQLIDTLPAVSPRVIISRQTDT